MPHDERTEALRALGGAVRTLRLAGRLSQEDLAEAAGLSARYVSDIERGRRNVGIVNLDRLSAALGVGLPELMAALEEARKSR